VPRFWAKPCTLVTTRDRVGPRRMAELDASSGRRRKRWSRQQPRDGADRARPAPGAADPGRDADAFARAVPGAEPAAAAGPVPSRRPSRPSRRAPRTFPSRPRPEPAARPE
jgi:hypothetical protein